MSAVVVHRAGDAVVVVAPAAAWQELAEIGLEAGRRRSADGRPLRSVTADLLARLRALGCVTSEVAGAGRGGLSWVSGAEARRLLGGLTLARLRQLQERGRLVAAKRGGRWWYDVDSVRAEADRRGLQAGP